MVTIYFLVRIVTRCDGGMMHDSISFSKHEKIYMYIILIYSDNGIPMDTISSDTVGNCQSDDPIQINK